FAVDFLRHVAAETRARLFEFFERASMLDRERLDLGGALRQLTLQFLDVTGFGDGRGGRRRLDVRRFLLPRPPAPIHDAQLWLLVVPHTSSLRRTAQDGDPG